MYDDQESTASDWLTFVWGCGDTTSCFETYAWVKSRHRNTKLRSIANTPTLRWSVRRGTVILPLTLEISKGEHDGKPGLLVEVVHTKVWQTVLAANEALCLFVWLVGWLVGGNWGTFCATKNSLDFEKPKEEKKGGKRNLMSTQP